MRIIEISGEIIPMAKLMAEKIINEIDDIVKYEVDINIDKHKLLIRQISQLFNEVDDDLKNELLFAQVKIRHYSRQLKIIEKKKIKYETL